MKARPRKAAGSHDGITRDQLIARVDDLEAPDSFRELDDTRRLLHDSEAQQVELELQNEELRRAQAPLEASRARLADLYDLAPVVYVTLDRQGRIVDANLTATSMFGMERGKLFGKFLGSLVTETHRRTLRQHLDRCFQECIRVDSEIELSIRGRPAMALHATSAPLISSDGTVVGCKMMLIDVTVSKRAQEKLVFLAHASATLAASFDYRANLARVAHEAVPVLADICVIDLVDADGVLNRLEVAFADPFKAERLARIVAIPTRSGGGTILGKVMETKEALLLPECSPTTLGAISGSYDHELLIRAAETTSMMAVPIVARDAVCGVFTFLAAESARRYSGTSLSTARDLAAHAALAIDNARLYERAQRAIRAREDMLSFVSHDLRNPLMGIQLTTETLLRSARGGEERRKGWKQLERIRRGTRQMRRMIDDLLDVASLEAGRLTLASQPYEAARLAEETVAMLAPIAVEKQVKLAYQAPGAELVIRGDRDRITQVLSNLIGNAIKFTPAGGDITVTIERAESNALFAVRDTGPGISPVVRPHIFERFWQAEETARKGRGLGLYIAKGLVEAQGGAIWVDSAGTGGTTFSFTLPLASAAEVDRFRATMETTRGSLGHDPIVGPG